MQSVLKLAKTLSQNMRRSNKEFVMENWGKLLNFGSSIWIYCSISINCILQFKKITSSFGFKNGSIFYCFISHLVRRTMPYMDHTIPSIDNLYPGLKDMLSSCVVSVRGQNRCALRTATDQCGEQTSNKDAKTTGGIRGFASNSVLKWTLNNHSSLPTPGHCWICVVWMMHLKFIDC